MEKKLDVNYTRMLRTISNKSWRHDLPPITKTIQVKRTRHAGHCWRSRDELISDILLWTPSHGRAKEGRPARTYIQQLCVDTGCSLEYLLGAMDDRQGWQERVKEIRTVGVTWCPWRCTYINIYIYIYIYTYAYIYNVYIYIYIYIYLHAFIIWMCAYARVYVCMHAWNVSPINKYSPDNLFVKS